MKKRKSFLMHGVVETILITLTEIYKWVDLVLGGDLQTNDVCEK